jgi:integrase
LHSSEDGAPLFEPTLFALTELRATNKASATIAQALRSVMLLYLVLDQEGINLDQRLEKGELLHVHEIDEIARRCRYTHCSNLIEERDIPDRFGGVLNLERVRKNAPDHQLSQVITDTVAIRMLYIRKYLNWRGAKQLLKLGPQHPLYASLASILPVILDILKERTPDSRHRNSEDSRLGLLALEQNRLLSATAIKSPDNPWKNAHVRARNELIVRWLCGLGLRRGELLNIQVQDIDFQKNEVRIVRRADDIDDPRAQQPNVKTRDRLLPVDADLATATHLYVRGMRKATRAAKKHGYLFVSNGTGAPMSLAALNKVFRVLRDKVTGLPSDLSPHVLRHTWNDNFSVLMDAEKVSEDNEKKMRSRLMGWSEISGTAATYTRRHIRNKARLASISLQKKMRTRGDEPS